MEIEKPQSGPTLIFVRAAWFALPNRCARHAAGFALCLLIRLKNCRPFLLDGRVSVAV